MAIISNDTVNGKSYTNKDFTSIYTELLDLASELTNKWVPSASNESDPGVVLLKLMALLGDKNDYNIDKNILEAFPNSATQVSSARKIYDLMGYAMKWYRSATTTIAIAYTGDEKPYLDSLSIKIPKFTTAIQDESATVTYTLIDDIDLNSGNSFVSTGTCIEGTIQDYDVNGVTTITLDNLDEDLRLYFTTSNIAENGIFVYNVDDGVDSYTDWERVDNLESHELSSKIFKFGVLPTSDTCYIEFPQDIGNLIGNGLGVKYTLSTGADGNIGSKTLVSVVGDLTVNIQTAADTAESVDISEYVTINNAASTSNGSDPEDLDSAYRYAKKVVDTFNTLVTVQDYEDYIFTLYDSQSNYLVGNDVVSDRTNDVHNAYTIITYDKSKEVVTDMTAFDIGLYLLKPMSSTLSATNYNRSFSVADSSTYKAVEDDIEDIKCVQHDYIDTTSSSVPFIYKNYYKLTCTIYTYYKVTTTEANEIITNVKEAIYKNLNSRGVDFGVEVDYDSLIDLIQSADTRIKYIILNEPEYSLYRMNSSDTIGTNSANNLSCKALTDDLKLELLAKMVLARNVQLYDFDDSFKLTYGMSDAAIYPTSDDDEITALSTNLTITANDLSSGYEVRANENVMLYTTNLITTVQYSTYVNYVYIADNSVTDGNYHCLISGETLRINYTDSNSVVQNKTYEAGDIIQVVGFDLVAASGTGYTAYDIQKNVGGTTYGMKTLSSSEYINIVEPNMSTLDEGTYCIWYTSGDRATYNETEGNTTYTLFNADETEYILKSGEYLMYTNSSASELVILSSGTKISRNAKYDEDPLVCTPNYTSDEVATDGLSVDNTVSNIFDKLGYALTITELRIVSLGEGAGVYGKVAADASSTEAQIITDAKYIDVYTTSTDDYTAFAILDNPDSSSGVDYNVYIWPILNLNVSNEHAQELLSNQKIELTLANSEDPVPITGDDDNPISIMTNIALASSGPNVDVSLISDDEVTYPLKLLQYKLSLIVDDTAESITTADSLIIYASTDDFSYSDDKISGSGDIAAPLLAGNSYLVNIYVGIAESGSVTLSLTGSGSISNLTTASMTSTTYTTSTFATLKLDIDSDSDLKITWNTVGDDSNYIQIYTPIQLTADIYTNQILDTLAAISKSKDDLINELGSLVEDYIFDYASEIESSDAIDTSILSNDSNDLFDAKMVWDKNHILNKFTIAQYDTINSTIKIANSSKQ